MYLRNVRSNQYIGCKSFANNDGYSIFDTRISVDRNENMALHLSRASNSEMTECNFLLSCRPFVQQYLAMLSKFDELRQQETSASANELLYYVLKLNSMYSNILTTLDKLTLYALNQIMVENSVFNRDLISNRKKILNELDFIEMFCSILNLYFDYKDLEAIRASEVRLARRKTSSADGSIAAEDVEKQNKDKASLQKMLSKYYARYVANGDVIMASVYKFLKAMVRRDDTNQRKLYSLLFCFQKHFAYFDQSLDLVLVMIEDNLWIMNKLADSFFESLSIVRDLLLEKDKKQFFEVDIEIVDRNQYLFHEPVMKENNEEDNSAEEINQSEVHLDNNVTGRPTNMLVYLLILLSRKVRVPLILRILANSCIYKGANFVPNQDNLIELFTGNEELILYFLSDLRMGKVQSVKRLMNRFEGEEKFMVLRSAFQDKKIVNPNYESRIMFLTEQINLYSTLCNGRNLKWKNFLMRLFPQADLMNEIIEPDYSNGSLA